MEKLLFNPKPLSKAESIFLKRLNKRHPDFQVGQMDRIVRESMADKKAKADEITQQTPEYLSEWIKNN